MNHLQLRPIAVIALAIFGSACTESDRHMMSYQDQLRVPNRMIQFYSDRYARHTALCNPKDRVDWNCKEMKADLSVIQRNQRQALAIYDEAANDPELDQQDREGAKKNADALRVSLGEPTQ